MKTYIVKFGGSVITDKGSDRKTVNVKMLRQLSSEIAKVRGARFVIVHGAGPFGHVPAKKYALKGGIKGKRQVEGFSVTHQSMEELNSQVVAALVDAGVSAIAYQPSAGGVLSNGRLSHFPVKAMGQMLDVGLTPVLYGDVLVDTANGAGILSGDQLVPYLARKLGADKVVIVTSHNGIFDRDPGEKGAKKMACIRAGDVHALSGRKTQGTDVTGGIFEKVKELVVLAKNGVPSEIIGPGKGYLKKVLSGEDGVGTKITK